MSKVVIVQLEWKYSPESYLEEPIFISFKEGELEIKDGVAIARIDPHEYNSNSSLRERLTRQIESRLHAVQIMTHKDFELGKPSRTDIREDGKKNYYIEPEPSVMTITSGQVDLVVKDKDGNVIADTKKERLNKQTVFATLVDKHRDSNATLDQMLKSYQESVKDPNNELVHLYEIRDSLSKRFGSKSNAIKELGITDKEWDEIGKLANSLPLNQGRHRGKAVGALRDADLVELESARKCVAYLIEKYLEYLEPDPLATVFPAGDPVATANGFATAQSAAGYCLDFTLASLETEVDRLVELPMFNHGRDRSATMEKERNEAALGAYIGESLRQLFGGEWVGSFHPESTTLNFYRSFVMFGDYRFEPHLFISYRITNGKSEGSFHDYLQRLLPRIKARTSDG